MSFCEENALYDPSEITDEAPNHVAYYITVRFEGGVKTGSCDNIRSAIMSYYKCVVKCSDRWAFDNHLKKRIGNPCDAIEVTELIKGVFNSSRSRGDVAKRAVPLTISVLCQLWEFVRMHVLPNPNVADECHGWMCNLFLLMVSCGRAFSVTNQTFVV